jgi:hypothetical protein
MPTTVQFRRGTSSQLSGFTGANGELVFDTTLKTLRLQDGITSGGIELLRKDFDNLVTTVTTVTNIATTLDTWSTSSYRSAKYTVTITDNTNVEYETCEVSVIHNDTNPFITVSGQNYTGASSRMSFTATIATGTLTFQGTGVSADNTVKFIRYYIPV